MELRRIVEFNRKSKRVGVSIPSEWAEEMKLGPKQYVKMELAEGHNSFRVSRIWFQET